MPRPGRTPVRSRSRAPATGECVDGMDNDGDGTMDFDGGSCGPEKKDAKCLHSNMCASVGGMAAQHEHAFEGGEQLLLTGTVSFCTVDGDWESRLFDVFHAGRSFFEDPTNYETGKPGILRGLLHWIGSQCRLMADYDAAEVCKHEGACEPFGPNSSEAGPTTDRQSVRTARIRRRRSPA